MKKFIETITGKNQTGGIFGVVLDYVITIEYQKRGNPHAHCLFWLKDPIRDEDIDKCISAEIPDPQEDPELFDVIIKQNLHGPCGPNYPVGRCVWVEQGGKKKCPKSFPKEFTNDTISDCNGYPLYKRRSVSNGGRQIEL